jgi:hypothetical protein
MTPQLALQPQIAASQSQTDSSAHLTTHLTDDQFDELLTRSANCAPSPAEAHLLACDQCATELAGLRESLSLFRRASTAYAYNQLRGMPRMPLPSRRIFSPALEPTWWVAAAAIVLAGLLPMQLSRPHVPQTQSSGTVALEDRSAQSDEALLEDIDRDTSASVPASMQALADPTAGAASVNTSISTSTQRKD